MVNGAMAAKRPLRSLILTIFVICSLFAVLAIPSRAHADDNSCLTPGTAGCSFGLPTFQYQLLLGQMAANPVPNVRPLDPALSEIGTDNAYRIVGGDAPYFDAPNGNEIGVVDTGFNFVNVWDWKGDWAEIAQKHWVRAEDLTTAASSTYAGVLIDTPLAFPMAWVLVPTRPSQIPGVKPDDSTPMLERYQRVNIFATVTLGDWDWYLVGPGQWI